LFPEAEEESGEGRTSSEEGSYLRLIDSCITQLKAQGPSRTCNESKEEEEEDFLRRVRAVLLVVLQEQLLRINMKRFRGGLVFKAHRWLYQSTLGSRVIKKKKKKKKKKNLLRSVRAILPTNNYST